MTHPSRLGHQLSTADRLPEYSLDSNNNRIFPPNRDMYPSMHRKTRRAARIVLFLLFLVIILLLFLSFDCWPALAALFDFRRAPLDSSPCAKNCLFGLRKPPVPGHVNAHSSSHHSNSLLARPLKHLDNSFSVARLSVERVNHLLSKIPQLTNNASLVCESRQFWRSHQRESPENRVSRLKSLCSLYDFDGKIFTYRTKSSNRAKNHHRHESSNVTHAEAIHCSTHTCPLLVNTQQRILACFVQKTASTSMKSLFLRLLEKNSQSDATITVENSDNLTVFHQRANDALHRISPVSLLGNSITLTYTKALFVRHPFVRLVSAFKDKAESSPEAEPFFWAQYWRPLLDKLHGKDRDSKLKLTFEEFVDNYLLVTDPYVWDEHWAPIWTRCEPCFVRYNLVGKLETSERDFRLLKTIISHASPDQISTPEMMIWANRNRNFGSSSTKADRCERLASKYAETRSYIAQLSPESIIELYKKFYLDFELFGYTIDELFA